MWSLVAGLLLGVLFAGCILNQLKLPGWERLANRIDPLGLLPHWGFFAPVPGHTGNHLVYRDHDGHSWQPWVEVPLPSPPAAQFAWNPTRFERKALLDLINGLAHVRSTHGHDDGLQFSGSYLALLAWVMAQETASSSTERQFAVVMCKGHGQERTLQVSLVSQRHAISRT